MAGAEDEKKMPLLEHLVELRRRLLYSAVGFILAFLFCFYFAQDMFNFLAMPLADYFHDAAGGRLLFTPLTPTVFPNLEPGGVRAAWLFFPALSGANSA